MANIRTYLPDFQNRFCKYFLCLYFRILKCKYSKHSKYGKYGCRIVASRTFAPQISCSTDFHPRISACWTFASRTYTPKTFAHGLLPSDFCPSLTLLALMLLLLTFLALTVLNLSNLRSPSSTTLKNLDLELSYLRSVSARFLSEFGAS